MALYQAFRSRRSALLYSGMAAAMYASVIASASRAGAVLVTAEILAVALCMAARGFASGRAIAATLLRAVVLFAAFTAIVGWQRVWDRFLQPDPMNGRRELAAATLHIVADHPYTGCGLGTWPTVYPRYATVDNGLFANQAHDDWLQFAAEGGIPFGILLLTLPIWALRPAFRSIWGIGVIAVFLHSFVDYPFSRPALGSWTILVLAMLAAASRPAHPSAPSKSASVV
jgi:O-antigen ligase